LNTSSSKSDTKQENLSLVERSTTTTVSSIERLVTTVEALIHVEQQEWEIA
jgi:hypothetical protein